MKNVIKKYKKKFLKINTKIRAAIVTAANKAIVPIKKSNNLFKKVFILNTKL